MKKYCAKPREEAFGMSTSHTLGIRHRLHCCFVTFVRAKKNRLKNMQRQRKIVPCDRGQEDRLQGFGGYCAVLKQKWGVPQTVCPTYTSTPLFWPPPASTGAKEPGLNVAR